MGVRAIWTDFGGVLTPPIEVTMTAFCQRMNLEPRTMQRAMHAVARRYGTDVMAPLDTPLVSEGEWVRQVEEVLLSEHGVRADLSGFADKWFAGRQTNEEWLAILHGLRSRGIRLGMLSNMVPSWDEHWRRMVPPEDLFEEVVLSFEVGYRKPEQGIFDLAAARMGLEPAQCLLIDDLEANCRGAVDANWQAILFTDARESAARVTAALEDPAARGASGIKGSTL